MPARSSKTAAPDSPPPDDAVPDPMEGHSKRFGYFYKALQLAAQKASTKWSEEDFAQCFPTWAKESPQGVAQVRVQIGQHIRSQIVEQTVPILDSYRAADGIDVLSNVIQDAKERAARGEGEGGDVWREGLTPRILAHARTGRVLEGEKERLLGLLKDLEQENDELYTKLETKRTRRKEVVAELHADIAGLDEAIEEMGKLPIDDASDWMETVVDPVPMEGS